MGSEIFLLDWGVIPSCWVGRDRELWSEQSVCWNQRGEEGDASGIRKSFSSPVALEAQTLKMWRSHSMTDQTGRKAGRIYQTTNEQRIESCFFFFFFWLMPNDCVAGLGKMKYWTTKHHHLGLIKDFLLSLKLKLFWFVWSQKKTKTPTNQKRLKYHGHV